MYIDSHAHIYEEYYDNIKKVKNDAIHEGVTKIINCSTSFENFDQIIELSKKNGFYYALGIHPECVEDNKKIEKLEEYIMNNIDNPKFVGIGEIGLDFYYSKENKKEQIEMFDYQLKLASKYKLPVIIHSREATQNILELLKKYNLKGIIHCFSGSAETAREYIKLGYKLGIGGIITFKNCNLKNYIKEIGLNNIVLETDCPYMTPEPFRKYKNEPKYISTISEYIANIFRISSKEVAEITTQNCNEIFDFKDNK